MLCLVLGYFIFKELCFSNWIWIVCWWFLIRCFSFLSTGSIPTSNRRNVYEFFDILVFIYQKKVENSSERRRCDASSALIRSWLGCCTMKTIGISQILHRKTNFKAETSNKTSGGSLWSVQFIIFIKHETWTKMPSQYIPDKYLPFKNTGCPKINATIAFWR